jgi:hypothetical protein
MDHGLWTPFPKLAMNHEPISNLILFIIFVEILNQ